MAYAPITESSAPNRVSGTVRVIRIAWSVDCSVDSLVVKYRNAYQSVFNYSQLQQRRGRSNPSLRSPRGPSRTLARPPCPQTTDVPFTRFTPDPTIMRRTGERAQHQRRDDDSTHRSGETCSVQCCNLAPVYPDAVIALLQTVTAAVAVLNTALTPSPCSWIGAGWRRSSARRRGARRSGRVRWLRRSPLA